MQIVEVDIAGRKQIAGQLVDLWERSVRASHTFLTSQEILNIKKYVPSAICEVEHLIVAQSACDTPLAFMGITGDKMEMLFVEPSERGKGIGRQLVGYGLSHLGLKWTTVNEQNPQAIGFYEKMGFSIYKRSATDEQGMPYPILYMKHVKSKILNTRHYESFID